MNTRLSTSGRAQGIGDAGIELFNMALFGAISFHHATRSNVALYALQIFALINGGKLDNLRGMVDE